MKVYFDLAGGTPLRSKSNKQENWGKGVEEIRERGENKKRKEGEVVLLVRSHSTRLLAATTLRNVLGTRNLSEILSEREAISHNMQASLDEATDPWGVKVERVEM